jgi:hypothetical protein
MPCARCVTLPGHQALKVAIDAMDTAFAEDRDEKF